MAQLPFSHCPDSLFLALPVCIDSIDKHSPGSLADSASSHFSSSSYPSTTLADPSAEALLLEEEHETQQAAKKKAKNWHKKR